MPYHLTREDWQRWAVNGLDEHRESKRIPLEFIAPMQRRRLNRPARLMFSVLRQLDLPENTPLIFASHDGQSKRSFSLWLELLGEGKMSPMSFGLSVHNALAGSWSLHSRNRAEMNAISATEAILETALLEGCMSLFAGALRVAVVVVEAPCILPMTWWRRVRRFLTPWRCWWKTAMPIAWTFTAKDTGKRPGNVGVPWSGYADSA